MAAFKRLLTDISSVTSTSGRGWDLTEASTYEKQCRRIGLKKSRGDWILITTGPQLPIATDVPSLPVAPVRNDRRKATVAKRQRVECGSAVIAPAEFATKQDLDAVRGALGAESGYHVM